MGPCLDRDSEVDVKFAVLEARYGEMLRRFLLGLCRRPEVAADLTQQLWLKLLEAARAGRFLPVDDASLRSYLFAAARNLFLDECVRKHGSARTVCHDPQSMDALADRDSGHGVLAPEDQCHRAHVTATVQQAIQRLPDAQQAVIRMWMSGASIEAMVVATGSCRDTVLSRKKYAMRRLRAGLADLRGFA
jgi:RNA polymerase sigma factor (sigma-70 family)